MWPFTRRKSRQLGQPQNILTRTQNLLRANIHKALDEAEDPVKTIDLFIRDYTENLTQAEDATAEVIGQLRLLEIESNEAHTEYTDLGHKAVAASHRADDARAKGETKTADKLDQLAARALRKQIRAEQRVKDLQPSIQAQSQSVEQLKHAMSLMRERLEDLNDRRNDVASRVRTADAKDRVVSAVSSLNSSDPTSDISRIEGTVRRREALTQGRVEVAALSLESQFDELETLGESALAENRLEQIKSGKTDFKQIEEP